MSSRTLLCSISLALLLTLTSCLPVPLGDPAKSALDPKLVGSWQWPDGELTNLAVVRAWDDHTYIVDCFGYRDEAGVIKPKGRSVFKGWLTDVKGQRFITLQPIEVLQPIPGHKQQKLFISAKLALKDNVLTATGLDGGYEKFKTVGTATELAKVVSENMEDVRMWVKPIVMKQLGDNEGDHVEKVSKAFQDMK